MLSHPVYKAKGNLFFKSHQGPKLWQELPSDIQNSKSLIIFKKRIKKYFINMY